MRTILGIFVAIVIVSAFVGFMTYLRSPLFFGLDVPSYSQFLDTLYWFSRNFAVVSTLTLFGLGVLEAWGWARKPKLSFNRSDIRAYFTPTRRAIADLGWVSMSLASIATVIVFAQFSNFTPEKMRATTDYRGLLEDIGTKSFVFERKWCSDAPISHAWSYPPKRFEYGIPSDKGSELTTAPEKVTRYALCEANVEIARQRVNIYSKWTVPGFKWKNAPMFDISWLPNNAPSARHGEIPDIIAEMRAELTEITDLAVKFSEMGQHFRASHKLILTAVILEVLRYLLLHGTAWFGALRLMRSVDDYLCAKEELRASAEKEKQDTKIVPETQNKEK